LSFNDNKFSLLQGRTQGSGNFVLSEPGWGSVPVNRNLRDFEAH
jgi:hypothetical protein